MGVIRAPALDLLSEECSKDNTFKRCLCYAIGMAEKFSRHITLTGPLAAFVENEVPRGEYASVGETGRAAPRFLMDRTGEGKTASEPPGQPAGRPSTS